MDEIRKHIPNALTSANLILGCLAIIEALNGSLYMAGYFIVAAGILDFFDGFIARALHAQSELGKQLDSLADVVSFGVAPGMIFYMFAGKCLNMDGFCITPYVAFLIPVFSAIRLATFNIDTRQTNGFIGLPTPANAFLILSIPFAMDQHIALAPIFQQQIFLKLFPIASAYLLTSEIAMPALKFKTYSFAENKTQYLLIILGALSIAFFQIPGIGISILLYILIAIIQHFLPKKNI
jgi:CDP-diacylglycerol--serine O-phosphatidyltransferase